MAVSLAVMHAAVTLQLSCYHVRFCFEIVAYVHLPWITQSYIISPRYHTLHVFLGYPVSHMLHISQGYTSLAHLSHRGLVRLMVHHYLPEHYVHLGQLPVPGLVHHPASPSRLTEHSSPLPSSSVSSWAWLPTDIGMPISLGIDSGVPATSLLHSASFVSFP